MSSSALFRAWVVLLSLAFASTLLSLPWMWKLWPTLSGVGVLVLAWLKARVILARYLGLAAAPVWQRGFDISLGLFCLLLLGLYLASLSL